MLIMRGITAADAKESIVYLRSSGVTDVVELNPNRPESKICKIILVDDEAKSKLVNDGSIKVNYMRLHVEELNKPPMQCFKCKEFRHVSAECKNVERCAKCGHDHDSKLCSTTKLICPNCSGSHSCFYRGCPVYAQQMQIINNKNQGKSDFTRTYSEATTSTSSKAFNNSSGQAKKNT